MLKVWFSRRLKIQRYLGLFICLSAEQWDGHWKTHSTGMCVWISLQSSAEGRGLSFRDEECVLFWLVFTQPALCAQVRTMVWRPLKWRHKSQFYQSNKRTKWMQLKLFHMRLMVEPREKKVLGALCWGGWWRQAKRLHVFEYRLKIKTGRARFRETGKLMQGNGLRHQPAHYRLC